MTFPSVPGDEQLAELAASVERSRRADAALQRRRRVRKAAGANEVMVLRLIYLAADAAVLCSPRDLAEHTGLRMSTISILLDRLQQQGLIHRRPHPTDGRSVVVVPAGERWDIGVDRVLEDRVHALGRTLQSGEAEIVARYLTDMAHLIDDAS